MKVLCMTLDVSQIREPLFKVYSVQAPSLLGGETINAVLVFKYSFHDSLCQEEKAIVKKLNVLVQILYILISKNARLGNIVFKTPLLTHSWTQHQRQ